MLFKQSNVDMIYHFSNLIHNGMIHNTFATSGKVQGGKRLLVVVSGWTDCCYDESFTVTPETILNGEGKII